MLTLNVYNVPQVLAIAKYVGIPFAEIFAKIVMLHFSNLKRAMHEIARN